MVMKVFILTSQAYFQWELERSICTAEIHYARSFYIENGPLRARFGSSILALGCNVQWNLISSNILLKTILNVAVENLFGQSLSWS